MHTNRVNFLGVGFDILNFEEVLAQLRCVSAESAYTYLVTPNVDHIVRLNDARQRLTLLPDYLEADLCVCDSRVLSQLARLHGVHLPVVTGSDLTGCLLREVVDSGDRVTVVGGDKEMLVELRSRFPNVNFTHFLPPMGLRNNPSAMELTAKFLAKTKARFALIAVGSPQQEMIAALVRRVGGATGMALCVGASLEFITGRRRRAPQFIQKLGLEWAHRLISEPRRMWRRYLVEGPRVFLLTARFRPDDAPR